MKITLCGSLAFFDEMISLQQQLEQLDHQVKAPRDTIPDKNGELMPVAEFFKLKKSASDDVDWIWTQVQQNILIHFDKIAWADAILVCNHDKHDIANYIGGNTLMELGIALYLQKKIYLLNPIPEISYKEEILAMQPVVINQNLDLLSN